MTTHRHDRSALILFGSETGNSEDAAELLGRLAERLRFHARVASMDSVDIVRPSHTCLPSAKHNITKQTCHNMP